MSAALWVSPLPRTLLDSPAALYFGVLTLSACLSIDPVVSFLGVNNAYYNAVLPSLLVWGCFLLGHTAKRETLLKSLVLTSCLVSLIAVAQFFGYLRPYEAFSGGRFYSTLGNPVYMTSHLALGGVAAVILGWRWALPVLAVGCILGSSRASALSFTAGWSILWLSRVLGHPREPWRASRALLPALIVAFIGITFYARNKTTGYASDLGRKHMAQIALNTFNDNPWLGQGPDTFEFSMVLRRTPELDRDLGPAWGNAYVHNSYLEALATGGFLLLLAYMVLQLSITLALVRAGRYDTLALGVALVVFGLFQPTQLSLKAIYALILGASLEDQGYLSAPVTWGLRSLFLGISLAVSVFYVGGRLHKVAERLHVNVVAFNASRELMPMLYR